MSERVQVFGAHGGLVGILAEPDGGAPADRPVVLMANVGLNHRVGPNRLWVDLARRLARAGLPSLRFDLSGFGDSLPRPGALSDDARAVADFQEAMELLERKTGTSSFVLVGLCSGVDAAHAVAASDPRVAGAVFVDGYAYPTPGFRLRYRTTRNLQWGRWRRYFGRWRRRRTAAPREVGRRTEVYSRSQPAREQFARDLARMVGRGARLLFVFTGEWDNLYNYRGQFHDAFGYRDEVEVEHFPAADHLFTSTVDRARLLDRLCGWTAERFAAAPVAGYGSARSKNETTLRASAPSRVSTIP